jgi:hypothetical protein
MSNDEVVTLTLTRREADLIMNHVRAAGRALLKGDNPRRFMETERLYEKLVVQAATTPAKPEEPDSDATD